MYVTNLILCMLLCMGIFFGIRSCYINSKKNFTLSLIIFLIYSIMNFYINQSYLINIVIFIIGLILIVMEIILPGLQIFGVSGIACVLYAVYKLSFNQLLALLTIVMVILVSILSIVYHKKKGYTFLGLNKLVLFNKISSEDGFLANKKQNLIGKVGITTTPLRPAGYGVIDGKKYDLYSGDGFIPENCEVEVIKEESLKIIVRRK